MKPPGMRPPSPPPPMPMAPSMPGATICATPGWPTRPPSAPGSIIAAAADTPPGRPPMPLWPAKGNTAPAALAAAVAAPGAPAPPPAVKGAPAANAPRPAAAAAAVVWRCEPLAFLPHEHLTDWGGTKGGRAMREQTRGGRKRRRTVGIPSPLPPAQPRVKASRTPAGQTTHPAVDDLAVGVHDRAHRVPVVAVAHEAVAALLVEFDLHHGAEAWGRWEQEGAGEQAPVDFGRAARREAARGVGRPGARARAGPRASPEQSGSHSRSGRGCRALPSPGRCCRRTRWC
jgi:hypothetical protein